MEEVLKVVHPRTGGFASTYWYLSSVAATVECRAGWVEIFPTWSVGLVRGSVAVGGLSSLPRWVCMHYYYCYLCYWTGPVGHTVMLKEGLRPCYCVLKRALAHCVLLSELGLGPMGSADLGFGWVFVYTEFSQTHPFFFHPCRWALVGGLGAGRDSEWPQRLNFWFLNKFQLASF